MRSPYGLKEKEKILQRATKSCQSFLDLRGQHIISIPQEVFARPLIEGLRVLELSFNGLHSLPSCIGQLVSLEELYLGHNNVKVLPKELGDLPALTRLDVVHNGLREVPFCISNLRTLEWLNLAGNLVEVVPIWLLLLPNLQHLHLVHNLIENIPKDCYLQGIDCMRKYFRLPLIRDTNIKNYNTNLILLSPRRKCLTRPKLHSNTLDRPLLLSKDEPGFKKSVCEQTSPNSSFSQIKDDSMISASSPAQTLPGKYIEQHQNIVSNLEKSHQTELSLITQQISKAVHKQELRKKNIESLRKRRDQYQAVPFPFPRRLDFSLDLESLSRRTRCMTTSEYGSCSSITESIGVREHLSLNRKHSLLSVQSLTSLDDAFNNNMPANLGHRKLSSDSGSSCLSEISDNDCYISDSGLESVIDRRRHITLGDICVIIPEENITGHLQSDFNLEVVEDMSFAPKLKRREVLASEVVEMTPHGAKFYKDDPAIISLPFDVKVGRYDVVTCLCSNTDTWQRTRWEKINLNDYKVFTSHVEIKAYHFSLFGIVVTKGYPEARKTIKAGIGGCLYIPEVPGVAIHFPETSLPHDIEASVKVLYADDPYDVDHSDPEALALATPVIQLGPHGCLFNLHSANCVTVHLPLPDGAEILERYGDVQLTFWCSSTTEGEDLQWQQFHPRSFHIGTDGNTLCSVNFSVEHFSYFRVLWNIIDTILWEAKLGASSIIPMFQFNVSFQALMSELTENGFRFGLCVACYRFNKPLEDIGNFPIAVGKCVAPRLLHTGKLRIRLESNHFNADTSIGVKDLVAVENFNGRPFVIQFGCQSKGELPYGNFGNVFVEQQSEFGDYSPVFSFLLNKPRDVNDADSSLVWEVPLTEELINVLSIKAETDMGDEAWHEVAEQLGYTPREISNFSTNDKPIAAVIADYKRCGGTPQQLIMALYKTGSPGNMVKQKMNGTIGSTTMVRDISEMESKMCPCVKRNARKRRLPESVNWEGRFHELSQNVGDKWKQLGRELGVNDSKIKEIEHDCNRNNDSLYEKCYQVLLAWRDLYPDHCNLNTLSGAVCKVGLGYVARKCCLAVEMG